MVSQLIEILVLVLGMATCTASVRAQIYNVSAYGAVCDWNGTTGTDDTTAFAAAAAAASANFTATGRPTEITYSGNCRISGVVTYGSGVHWNGASGIITVPLQVGPTLQAKDADNVSWDKITVTIINSQSGTIDNPLYSPIQWLSTGDNRAHNNVAIRNCTVNNANWGILLDYALGSGSGLAGVTIIGNTVTSPTAYSNFDGIHVAGRIQNVVVSGNKVFNRGDAGIAFTSEKSGSTIYTPSKILIYGNLLIQDRVGIDMAGPTVWKVAGNYVYATVLPSPSQPSNPAFRCIYYNAPCLNGDVNENTLIAPNQGDDNVKVDDTQDTASGGSGTYSGAININFTGNDFGSTLNPSLYVRGSNMSINGNTFPTGGMLAIDYNSGVNIGSTNIAVGQNHWLGSGSVSIGANPSLITNVRMAMQKSLGTITYKNRVNAKTLNSADQTATVVGCNLTSTGNGALCPASSVLPFPQTFTDTRHSISCSRQTILNGSSGAMPVVEIEEIPNAVTNFPYAQAAVGNATGLTISPNYWTYTCRAVHHN